jgi:hypothetical protein
MNSDSILNGIDYFVDNDPKRIGMTYLGKPIKHPDSLLKEDKDNLIILIGSIVYRSEIAFLLQDMGFEEFKHFVWGISFPGDEKCPRLWRHTEWNDTKSNAANLLYIEQDDYPLERMKFAIRFVDLDKFDTIIDLSAANERMRSVLTDKSWTGRYIPVDYMKYSESTIICDFTKYQFPLAEELGYNPRKTLILSMGSIQYTSDWHWYLECISQSCSCFVLAKHDFASMKRDYRIEHWNHNHAAYNFEYILHMQKLGFVLTDAADFRLKSTIYKFEKRDDI